MTTTIKADVLTTVVNGVPRVAAVESDNATWSENVWTRKNRRDAESWARELRRMPGIRNVRILD